MVRSVRKTRRQNAAVGTDTGVVLYGGPPATPAVLTGCALWANVLKYWDSLAKPIVRAIATDVLMRTLFKRILSLLNCRLLHCLKRVPVAVRFNAPGTNAAGRSARRQGRLPQHAEHRASSFASICPTVHQAPFPTGRVTLR